MPRRTVARSSILCLVASILLVADRAGAGGATADEIERRALIPRPWKEFCNIELHGKAPKQPDFALLPGTPIPAGLPAERQRHILGPHAPV